MGHCNTEVRNGNITKLTEKAIDSKPKENVKNNTYENIKHLVPGQPKKVDEQTTQTPMKTQISIGL